MQVAYRQVFLIAAYILGEASAWPARDLISYIHISARVFYQVFLVPIALVAAPSHLTAGREPLSVSAVKVNFTYSL